MTTPRALRVLEARARVYRHTWRGSVASTFLTPVLYLAAMGIGLGALVDEGPRGASLGGLAYLAWLTPGLLAAAAMQTGFGDSAWQVMAGLKWRRTYHATLATPVGVGDLVAGHLLWVAVRVTLTVAVFGAVGVAFGAMSAGGAALAVGPALLTGLAFAGPVLAFTGAIDKDVHLATLQRFGIVPIFLFSGTFFPVSDLPAWAEWVAWATPLWHGVELTRAAALGLPSTFGPAWHASYLLACLVAGWALARRSFARRLTP